jgi:hypothetical protein
MAKKVRYTQPLLGEANAAGYLIAVPGASVLIRQDGVECDVFADNDGAAMTNPVPSGVSPGTAGVDTRGTLVVYLEPGNGYDGVATVGNVASTFPIPDISPDVSDVPAPIPPGTYVQSAAPAAEQVIQQAIGQRPLVIRSPQTAATGDALLLIQGPNRSNEVPESGRYTFVVNEAGHALMNTSMTINGETATPIPNRAGPEEIPYMLGIKTDIPGPAILVTPSAVGSTILEAYTGLGVKLFEIDQVGDIEWSTLGVADHSINHLGSALTFNGRGANPGYTWAFNAPTNGQFPTIAIQGGGVDIVSIQGQSATLASILMGARVMARLNNNGSWTFGGANLTTATLNVSTHSDTMPNIQIRRRSETQTARLLEFASDLGADLGGIGPDGTAQYAAFQIGLTSPVVLTKSAGPTLGINSVLSILAVAGNPVDINCLGQPIRFYGGGSNNVAGIVCRGPVQVHGDATGATLFSGAGAPAAAQGVNGDLYLRTDGGAGTTIYQKRAGAWVATAA